MRSFLLPRHRFTALAATALFSLIFAGPGCGEDGSSSSDSGGGPGSGGRAEQGGTGGSMAARGGSGGKAMGGSAGSDGGASAGAAEGGSAEGGSAEGGSVEGGSGGSAEGGSAEGGASTGGAGDGGSAEGGSSAGSGASAGSGGEAGGADGGSGGGASASDELCGERPGGTLYEDHVLRFENTSADLVVQVSRTYVGAGVGESSEYGLAAMGLRLGETTICITDAGSLMYENSHHNWLDVARGTSEGIRYEAHLRYEPAAGGPPYLVAFDADEEVFYPETTLIATGRPPFCFACPGSASPPIGISEIQVDNVSTLADEEGEYDPWVEIFNVTSESLDLSGWTLSDDFGEREKWALPSVMIAPGQLLVVFADGQPEQGDLHASFRLSADGGEIVLTAPDGVTDGGFVYEATAADMSFAYDWATGGFAEAVPTPGVGPPE